MILLDSNLIIYSTDPSQILVRRFIAENETGASAISYVETLGFHQISMHQKSSLESFFAAIEVLPLDPPVIEHAVYLRQQRRMSLGDALIAGTALAHDLPLATNDIRDFRNIPGLKILTPV